MTGDLFDPRTVKRLCENITISKEQENAAKQWLNLLENNKLEKEKKNNLKFAKIILKDILGYQITEIDFEVDNVEFQYPEEKSIVCFETKGTKTKDLFAMQHRAKKEHVTPIKQTGDYMMTLGLDYGVCTNYRDFVLITKQYGYSKHYKFDFKDIQNETGIDTDKLKEFIGIFSWKRFESGFAKTLSEKSIIEQKEFTKEFYKLFHETRLILIESFQRKENVTKNEAIYYAQIFLNRMIFIFFVDDRGFVPDAQRLFYTQVLNLLKVEPTEHSRRICDYTNEIFTTFDKGSEKVFGFNGGLFSGKIPNKIYFNDLEDKYLYEDIWQHSKLREETKLDENAEEIIKKYRTLNPIIANLLIMDSFDFNTEVSVNILGHIFEQSISDLEELQGSGTLKRKKDGIYYTSESITDYICRNTIIPYLSKSGKITDVHDLVSEHADDIKTLEQKFRDIKILDPACGSGAFLVKAVDILLEVHKAIRDYKESTGKYSGLDKWNEESEARMIIETNIYGVDINEQSVEISKLALFFKTASSTRKLPDISKNIKVGNSLISDINIDPKAFDWEKGFPEICGSLIDKPGFSIVIGNPPYVRQESLENKEAMQLPDQNNLDLVGFDIPSKTDLSGYFYYHFLNHLKNCGKLGFITSDSWMSYDYGQSLQQVLMNKSNIEILMRTKFNVFNDADVKTITAILKKSFNPQNIVNLIYVENEEDLSQPNIEYIKKPQNELKPSNWNLYFSNNELQPKIPMVKMQNIGKVRFGKKTGCNDFFVLTPKIIKEYEISEEYQKPVISGDIHEGLLEDSDAREYLLNVNESKGKLVKTENGKNVLRYIEKGENTQVIPQKGKNREPCMIPELRSVAGRNMWYSLDLENSPPIFLGIFADKQMKIYENNRNFCARNNFAYFTPDNNDYTHAFLAYLSSSWFYLYLEKHGHPAGGGALQFLTGDYKKSPVPDFDKMSKSDIVKMTKAWCRYREDFDQNKLDDVVFHILGFTHDERKQIEQELENMRDDRLSSKKSNL